MRILLGDDRIDFAKKEMPYIPNAEIVYVETPEEVIAKAQSEEFDIVITDLNYTPSGNEGIFVLEELWTNRARKILWTAEGDQENIRARAKSLGAEVLDKDELPTLVGISVSRVPLKQNGIVLVFAPAGTRSTSHAIAKMVEMIFDSQKVVVGSDLRQELETGKYGLVIDTTTFGRDKSAHGSVAHDMKYLKLPEVPRVVCIYNATKVVADIGKIVTQFFSRQQ